MVAVLSLLLVVVLSIIVTRVATIALTYTGLSRESARFQARSAFTGVGFTTSESERIVRHPVRRRIIMLLMLLGNAGIITAVASLMLTFVGSEGALALGGRAAALLVGVAVLWAVSGSAWFERRVSPLVARALRRYARLDVQDYAGLMHLAGEYQIAEMQVGAQDWIAHRTLRNLRLRDEGIVVLGIERSGGTYLGAAPPDTEILPDDVLVLYGRSPALADLDQRRRDVHGDQAHRRAVGEHERIVADELRAGEGRPS